MHGWSWLKLFTDNLAGILFKSRFELGLYPKNARVSGSKRSTQCLLEEKLKSVVHWTCMPCNMVFSERSQIYARSSHENSETGPQVCRVYLASPPEHPTICPVATGAGLSKQKSERLRGLWSVLKCDINIFYGWWYCATYTHTSDTIQRPYHSEIGMGLFAKVQPQFICTVHGWDNKKITAETVVKCSLIFYLSS